MLNSNFINISDSSIYLDSNCFFYPILSIYLLEIYLKESDDFIYKVFYSSSISKNSYSGCIRNKNLSLTSIIKIFLEVKDYIPRKLEVFLNKYMKACCLTSKKYFFLIKSYKRKMILNNFLEKKFNFCRYLDFFLFGCLSDLCYTQYLFRKYISFVRSNLHFDIQNTKITLLIDQALYFLGFQIKIVNKLDNNFNGVLNIKKDKLFVNTMLTRIKKYKKKNQRISINRINFELVLYFNEILDFKFSPGIFLEKKLWLSLFQQESVRSSRLGKLPFTNDSAKSMYKFFVSEIKKVYFGERLVYFFDSYISKMQFLVAEVIKGFKCSSDFQLVSNDVFLDNFLSEYEKYLFFFYNDIYFKCPSQPV